MVWSACRESMPKVTFIGRVLPEATAFTLRFAEPVNWNPGGVSMRLSVDIDQSKITVTCDLSEFRREYFADLHNGVYDLVRTHVNLVSFCEGFGWIVFLETFIDPDGNRIPLYTHFPKLAAECTAFKMDFAVPEESPDFIAAAKAVITEPALLYALNDLMETLTRPHIAPVNCGRVLDGLRKIVAPNEEAAQGWPILREIVNVDEPFLRYVMDLSKNPRHGDRSYIDGQNTREVVRRCWAVMNRFIEYRKRGSKPLSDFATLRG